MSMRTFAMLALVLGCASKQPPATTTAPETSKAPVAEERCPAPPLDRAIGQPCAKQGMSCGAEACRDATGFCNTIVCRGGTWSNVEVPPPPPP